MKAYGQHRFWGQAVKYLILAGTVATVVTLVSQDGLHVQAAPPSATHETIQNSITIHDGNQASQHNALSGQATTHDAALTAHDGAQTSQHEAISQQISNLSTGGDHSGLPPAWDKILPANDLGGPCPANSSRFTCVMGNAAVRDNETGLVWEQSPGDTNSDAVVDISDELAWFNARFHCADKAVGGRKGWRLPSFAELASLIDPSVAFPSPAIPAGHPFSNVQNSEYWSATTNGTIDAWLVHLGGNVSSGNKSSANFVWCVRGGMNADQY